MINFYESRSYKSEFRLSVSEVKNLLFLAHWHNDVEIVFVKEGKIIMGINSETCVLNKGEAAICCSGDIHFYNSEGLNSKILLLIFHPELVDCQFVWPKSLSLNSSFIRLEKGKNEYILKLIEQLTARIYEEFQNKEANYQTIIKGCLLDLCGNALRHLPNGDTGNKSRLAGPSNVIQMQTILEYLEKCYNENISLEYLSGLCHLSKFYFSRVFKKATGMTLTTYINTLRVGKSEFLLKKSDAPIAQIAFECGFRSLRTFNREFKKIKGYSPSYTRKTNIY